MSAEEIAKDESRDWIDRIRAVAELEYKQMTEENEENCDRKPLSLADRVYIARYYEHDGSRMMGQLYGRDRRYFSRLIYIMKKTGEYELYKNLTDEEYEKIVIAQERRERNEMQSKRMPANSHNIMGDCISM